MRLGIRGVLLGRCDGGVVDCRNCVVHNRQLGGR